MVRRWCGAAILVALLGVGGIAFAGGDEAISQGEWALMLVERLGVGAGLPEKATPQDAASLLGTRAPAIERDAAAAKLVTADGAQRSFRHDVTVPATAMWLVTIANSQPAFVSVDKAKSTLLAAGGADGASDAGTFPLAAGAHTVTVTTNQPTAPALAMTAGCRPVLPAGGWQTSAKLTYGNLGRTLVQALRQDGRLPASDGLTVVPATAATVTLDVPADGTYTLLLGGKALARASYRLGGCEETIPGTPAADGWREGATVFLDAGRRTLALAGADTRLADGKVRLVRRSSADAEYLAVLQSMGVKLSGEGKTTGALPGVPARTGLARRAHGDAATGLAALAASPVTREEAERILATPSIARLLARGTFPRRDGTVPRPKRKDDEAAGTLVEPVTSTLQPAQDPDPR